MLARHALKRERKEQYLQPGEGRLMAEKDSGHILPGFAKKKGTNYQGMVYIQNTKNKERKLEGSRNKDTDTEISR